MRASSRWLLTRDVAILLLALACLISGPHLVDEYLERIQPRLVDCNKPLKEGEHRIERVHADGRVKWTCKPQPKS